MDGLKKHALRDDNKATRSSPDKGFTQNSLNRSPQKLNSPSNSRKSPPQPRKKTRSSLDKSRNNNSSVSPSKESPVKDTNSSDKKTSRISPGRKQIKETKEKTPDRSHRSKKPAKSTLKLNIKAAVVSSSTTIIPDSCLVKSKINSTGLQNSLNCDNKLCGIGGDRDIDQQIKLPQYEFGTNASQSSVSSPANRSSSRRQSPPTRRRSSSSLEKCGVSKKPFSGSGGSDSAAGDHLHLRRASLHIVEKEAPPQQQQEQQQQQQQQQLLQDLQGREKRRVGGTRQKETSGTADTTDRRLSCDRRDSHSVSSSDSSIER